MKKLLALALIFVMAINLTGCSDANKVSTEISNDADNFKIYRTIKVFNCKTNDILFEFSGWCSIKVDSQDNQLEITYKTGDKQYAKDFIGLSNSVAYTITQEESSNIDKCHYEWRWDSMSTR